MAIDAALLDEVELRSRPRTILSASTRWQRPTISLGRNQKIDTAVDVDYCTANGIDIVHRPTGGRAVLHDDELTYAVISNDSSYFGDTIYGNYKRVSEALCLGFNSLGVPAVLAPETRNRIPSKNGADPPCFLSPSRYELMVDGRKIVGSAQRRIRSSFLAAWLYADYVRSEALARATRLPDARIARQGNGGLCGISPANGPLSRNYRGLYSGISGLIFRSNSEIASECRTISEVDTTK